MAAAASDGAAAAAAAAVAPTPDDGWSKVDTKKARGEGAYARSQRLSAKLTKPMDLQEAVDNGHGGLLATAQREPFLESVAMHLESRGFIVDANGEKMGVTACFGVFGDTNNLGSWFVSLKGCEEFFKHTRGGAILFVLWHPKSYKVVNNTELTVAAAFRAHVAGIAVVPKSAFEDDVAVRFLKEHDNGFSIPSWSFDAKTTEFFFGEGAFVGDSKSDDRRAVRWDDRLRIQTTPCIFLAMRGNDKPGEFGAKLGIQL